MTFAEATLVLVVLAVVAAAAAHRLPVPAPILVVLAGFGLGFLPGLPTPAIPPRLLLLGALPPLLFATARRLHLPVAREGWEPVALAATVLALATTAAVATVSGFVDEGLAVAPAVALGGILASTDPAGAVALGRRLRLPDRVITLVHLESVVNDAISLVLLQVALLAVTAGNIGASTAFTDFAEMAGGGVLIGLAVGGAGQWSMSRSGDPVFRATICLLTPFVAAFAADAGDLSIATAVITAGLVFADRGGTDVRVGPRDLPSAVYDITTFLLENSVLAVVGLELATFLRELPASDRTPSWELIATVPVTVMAVRAIALLVRTHPPSAREHRLHRLGLRLPRRPYSSSAAVVAWASGRGVIPLAAALSVPLTAADGESFPHRPMLILVTVVTVLANLLVQGWLLRPVARRLDAVSASVGTPVPTTVDDTVGGDAAAVAGWRQRAINAERQALQEMHDQHKISEDTYQQLVQDLDRDRLELDGRDMPEQ